MSGLTSYLAGKAAEDSVLQHYLDRQYRLVCRRWRGRAGEIDLVMSQGDEVIFVEVKKSSSFAAAALRLTKQQISRLLRSAEDCLGHFPMQSLTAMRFDVALVDGGGQIDVVENALMA